MKLQLAGVAALTMVAGGFFGSPASAAETIEVTEDDITRQAENTPPTDNWVLYTRTAGNGEFRMGPSQPPLGEGSHELSTPTGADKVTLFNFDHAGTALADVYSMGYSTYRMTGAAQQVAALNIQVDVNGDAPGGFTTLVFEPVYNTEEGGVTSEVWQHWDAYDNGEAVWWSSNPIPSAPNRDTFVSWDTIVASNPDAVIVGGFGLNQGSGNPALVTAVDALNINDTTYDFDVDATDCKKGQWADFTTPSFKNQGDCVSYFASSK